MKQIKFIDVMVDIETLGVSKGATITQIAAAAFNVETGELMNLDEFGIPNKVNYLVNIEKIPADKLKIDASTLKFWMKTEHNQENFKEILFNDSVMSEEDALERLVLWLNDLKMFCEELTLWGNGIVFDNVKLAEKTASYGLEYPIDFWNERDVRTVVDLAARKLGINDYHFKNKFYNKNKHDAYADIMNQIYYTSAAVKALTMDASILKEEQEKYKKSQAQEQDS